MDIPKIVKHETEYFIITLWKNHYTYADSPRIAFETIEKARAYCRQHVNGDPYKYAIIRKETVFRRDENCELSTDSPVELIDIKGNIGSPYIIPA